MAANSSGDHNFISLPKGGGAQQGLGEKFSPDLFTGTGNFSVPIALPAGRNGFQPDISLVYSTGNGNGPFGLGWNLSIPGVSRKTSKGVPTYDNDKDVFILSGAEDLIEVPEAPQGSTRYRPRTEGLFALIDHFNGKEGNYWRVKSKDGLVSYYGKSNNQNTRQSHQETSLVYKPGKKNKIFTWKLAQTVDPFGNKIVYEYERDDSENANQVYLKAIRYINIKRDQGDTQFLVSVQFIYENRPDPFSFYKSGFEIQTRKRCNKVEVRTHIDDSDDQLKYIEQGYLIRTYDFLYLDEVPERQEDLPLNRISLLHQVKVTGHDGEESEALPPLEFNYSKFEYQQRKFEPLEGYLPPQPLNDPNLAIVDLFGNGLPDFVEVNGSIRYWRNLGNGTFDMPKLMEEAPAGIRLGNLNVQFLDANGNGRTDLLVMNGTHSGYYPARFGATWDRKSFQSYKMRPSFSLEDPEVQMVDLNGDGITDVIRSGSRLECFFNDPKEGWNQTRWVERQAIEDFPNINFSDPRVRWADMSGDGLQDIVLVHEGSIEYYPNLGHGAWGSRRSMRKSPRFKYGYNPQRILIGDVDGDGFADLIYVEDTKITLWINQCGNGWSDPIVIRGTPPVRDTDNVRLVDLYGTGVSGILWSTTATALNRKNLFFLDFTGGSKPYLLHEMNNNMGAITKVKYMPSTHFYLNDQKQVRSRWLTTLPFPVQVVAKVEVVDELSKGKLTTSYRYHHGYWDGGEREFRGFGRVDQRDTETFEHYHDTELHEGAAFKDITPEYFSLPLETRTWFHQGPIGDNYGAWEEADYSHEFWKGDKNMLKRTREMKQFLAGLKRSNKRDALRTLRGSILRTELYALDGTARADRPYTVTEQLYGVSSIPIGEPLPTRPESWQEKIFFPHALAQRTTQWERGDDPMTQFSFTEGYDPFGQVKAQVNIACPRGWRSLDDHVLGQEENPGESKKFLATRSEIQYALPEEEDTYIFGRVSRTTSYEIPHPAGGCRLEYLREIPEEQLSVIGKTINHYDGAAFEGLPEGIVGKYGALVRSRSLVLNNDTLEEVWGKESIPVYLQSGQQQWPDIYPEAFRSQLPNKAGYELEEDDYYATTQRSVYDWQLNHWPIYGLVQQVKDSLGATTTINYDSLQLLPEEVIDPLDLSTKAQYNYQTFQPKLFEDENGNRQAFEYSPLGLPLSIAIMGKDGHYEGDESRDLGVVPSTRFEYDFLAFMNSPSHHRQPIYVRTIKREHHITESGLAAELLDAIIETIEFSDGFGRLLQTRTQAEDVVWGIEGDQPGTIDDDILGNEILPANQDDQEKTGKRIIGVKNTDPENPNVVVSGWQVYDNKGQVVEKYEPFFSKGWDFALPEGEIGQKVCMYYDPRGQVVRTSNPDHSEQLVIYGRPVALSDPKNFMPTPWEAYTYDPNDNAGRTHLEEAQTYQNHWNTPANILIDGLGRTIRSIERNGAGMDDQFITRSAYDIQGNLLTVWDSFDLLKDENDNLIYPYGRKAFQYKYDLAGNVLKIDSIDAGIRQMVLDVRGQEIERHDSKGAIILQAYDAGGRPTHLWAKDAPTQEHLTMRQLLLYGDSQEDNSIAAQKKAKENNLLGKLQYHYDEAGLLTFLQHDFKGNLLHKSRRIIKDEAILTSMGGKEMTHFVVDWANPDRAKREEQYLHPESQENYETNMTYDALNRVVQMTYPKDVEGNRQRLKPEYNRAGALQSIHLHPKKNTEENKETYVHRIAYNARGQRTLIVYGNHHMTRYAYDDVTFRLSRLRTEKYKMEADIVFVPQNGVLQDFSYTYDLAGNILEINHKGQGCGVKGADTLLRKFGYDPLYRLISATGREQNAAVISKPKCPWLENLQSFDTAQNSKATRGYTRHYHYDKAGNMQLMEHMAGKGNQIHYKKNLTTLKENNRLERMVAKGIPFEYVYDANGNMTRETLSRHFDWNHSDQLHAFRQQVNEVCDTPTLDARYLYDEAGIRVKKLAKTNGGYRVTHYVDGIFEQYFRNGYTNNTLHIMDDQQRIALKRVGSVFIDDQRPTIQFHFGDHLGSSNVTITWAGKKVNWEEYFPYGGTSFGGFKRKKYRYSSLEYSEESSLYYANARSLNVFAMRWLTCDPINLKDNSHNNSSQTYPFSQIMEEGEMSIEINPYCTLRNNPINFVDLDGKTPRKSTLEKFRDFQHPDKKLGGKIKYRNLGILIRIFSQMIGWEQIEDQTPKIPKPNNGKRTKVQKKIRPPEQANKPRTSPKTHKKNIPRMESQKGVMTVGGVFTLTFAVLSVVGTAASFFSFNDQFEGNFRTAEKYSRDKVSHTVLVPKGDYVKYVFFEDSEIGTKQEFHFTKSQGVYKVNFMKNPETGSWKIVDTLEYTPDEIKEIEDIYDRYHPADREQHLKHRTQVM